LEEKMPRTTVLNGVRILDLSQAHAGPFGSQLLGDLGAEVIKIEPPGVGDTTRVMTPQLKDQSYYILALNRNKISVELNLRTQTGKEAFFNLVKISDAVWSNLRSGVLERLGFDFESLQKVNPRIIMCTITGYGNSGPYARYPSYDDNIQGLTGIFSLCGQEGGVPMRSAVAIADIAGGLFGAIGLISALYHRECTGVGRKVELNLVDCCMSLLDTHYQSYFLTGKLPKPAGSHHPIGGISGVYRTRNGYIILGPCWPRIAKVINREHLIDDPRFSTYEKRFQNKDALNEAVEEGLSEADTEDWLELMHEEDIPAMPLNTLDKALQDPQIQNNKVIIEMQHRSYGEIKAIDCPIKVTGAGEKEHSPAPMLGEGTEQVLRELLGYSEEKIMELKREQSESAMGVKKRVISGF
jgi:crotonobetainyl-CoA:carnitine CoA-transferase CaiB-like acyl-CoA transferase